MTEKEQQSLPELLAPAGNLATALTALDCGADAVYIGLNRFSARDRTENFTFTELSKLLAYSKPRNKRVYVTLNTLLKESELAAAAEYLAELTELQPDAVIVQDIGVIRMIREFFPTLPLHASTQMGIHNSAGIEQIAELGISRVILERQVMLDELREIMQRTDIEVEVFVHGALCCSLSGQCLFSSWLGGWSGNRGKCKQPCRRRFFSRQGNGFFFSPQDLYMLEHLHTLKHLGVASLKIEGRLRQPDYVRNVVTAYRMILDCDEEPSKELLGKARNILSGSPGRKWSLGFATSESMATLIQHNSMGASGLLCGSVLEADGRGFRMLVKRRLQLGDRIRIQPVSGDEGPALTVTKMTVGRRNVKHARSGEECFIFCDRPVVRGSLVYKIGESSDDLSGRIARLPLQLPTLNFTVTVRQNGVVVDCDVHPAMQWHYEHRFETAEKHPLTGETLVRAFSTAPAPFCRAGDIRCRIEGSFFIAAGELKRLRRLFWEWVAANITPEMLTRGGGAGLEKFYNSYTALQAVGVGEEREVVAVTKNGCQPAKRDGIIAMSVFNFTKNCDEVILPHLCPENRLPGLRKRIRMAYDAGIRRFRITALFGLQLLRDYQDITITSSFPLPVTNSMAVAELAARGVGRVQGWVELSRGDLEELRDRSVLPLELYRYGRPPLLATRATVAVEGLIHDGRKNQFRVEQDRYSRITYILPKTVLSIPRLPGTVDFYDLSHAYWNEKEQCDFNFTSGLI